jgi:hypothetical protein
MEWTDVTTAPSRRTLRQFAALLVLFAAGGLAMRVFRGPADVPAGANGLASVAVFGTLILAGLAGLAEPRAVAWLYRAAMVAVFPVGWVVSPLLLAAIYFLVFTPVAMLFRLRGRDALSRRRRHAASYWREKAPNDDPRRYLRQF